MAHAFRCGLRRPTLVLECWSILCIVLDVWYRMLIGNIFRVDCRTCDAGPNSSYSVLAVDRLRICETRDKIKMGDCKPSRIGTITSRSREIFREN